MSKDCEITLIHSVRSQDAILSEGQVIGRPNTEFSNTKAPQLVLVEGAKRFTVSLALDDVDGSLLYSIFVCRPIVKDEIVDLAPNFPLRFIPEELVEKIKSHILKR